MRYSFQKNWTVPTPCRCVSYRPHFTTVPYNLATYRCVPNLNFLHPFVKLLYDYYYYYYYYYYLTIISSTIQGGGYAIGVVCHSVILSVILSAKVISHFTETWCYDWAYLYIYQSEELINFWWRFGPGYGFWITFPLLSPLQNRGF